jgi:putative Holliday junction resolvase
MTVAQRDIYYEIGDNTRPGEISGVAQVSVADSLPQFDSQLPPSGVLLGIDYGTARIGVAMCDPERRIASPWQTYWRRHPQADASYFTQLVRDVRAVGIVVGLPLHADGRESHSSQQARAFAKWLAAVTCLPVVLWDERFTTHAAEAALLQAGLTHRQRRTRRDRVAAQMILQSYIEARRLAADPAALLPDTQQPNTAPSNCCNSQASNSYQTDLPYGDDVQ